MATTRSDNLFHIVMFPWFATGHMTPYLHLSNQLAKKGHKITFLLPQKGKLQLQHLNHYPHLITFHTLTIPHVEGLPLDTQLASEIPNSLVHLLGTAMDKTRDQVEETLGDIKPHFIFHDNVYWVIQIAHKLGIKTVNYCVVGTTALAFALVPARNVPKDKPITIEELSQPPKGYPSKVVLKGPEARSLMGFFSLPFGEGNLTIYDRVTMSLRESDAIALRTTQEFEGNFCDYIASQYGKKVLLTGPMFQGEVEGKLEEKWANWLDGFEPGSVVFCAFGSEINLERKQYQELLLGFELSGLPFFVALKTPNGCESVEEALPEGFEERVKGRGVISSGWVQQLLILKHPSVGCFVSHCGFGTMWESLISDKQIVLVPHIWEHVLNTKLLVEELEVAVEVERGENGWVSKESLNEAIKLVMDEGSEVGAKVRKNHMKWKETGGSPGLMNGYIERFVEALLHFPK